jgi:glutamine synthetase
VLPCFEARIRVACCMTNRFRSLRLAARRHVGKRVVHRLPDRSAKPYPALAVLLTAGSVSTKTSADSRMPAGTNIFEMNDRKRRRPLIRSLLQRELAHRVPTPSSTVWDVVLCTTLTGAAHP